MDLKKKLDTGVYYDVTVIEKKDVYDAIGFWEGEVSIDLPEGNSFSKFLKDEYLKQFTRNMEVGKKYKIGFTITEL
jgi:hypothetical protein